MVTYIIARQLGGKPVITVGGEELGRLDDVIVDEIVDFGMTFKHNKRKHPNNIFVACYLNRKNFR